MWVELTRVDSEVVDGADGLEISGVEAIDVMAWDLRKKQSQSRRSLYYFVELYHDECNLMIVEEMEYEEWYRGKRESKIEKVEIQVEGRYRKLSVLKERFR